MIVVISENIPDRLRGRLSNIMCEIRAGVYVGDFSAKIRDKIFLMIQERIEGGNVAICTTNNSDIGYEVIMFGENRRFLVNFDGLNLIGIKE
jgi:CRISPR-associated protein Cas2